MHAKLSFRMCQDLLAFLRKKFPLFLQASFRQPIFFYLFGDLNIKPGMVLAPVTTLKIIIA